MRFVDFKNRLNGISLALLLTVALGSLLAFGGHSASAVGGAQNDVFIQVSPAKQNITLEPGSHYTGKFKVQNVGIKGFNYKVYVKPYKVINENYDSNYEDETARTQITRWVTFDKTSGYLDPETEAVVTYSVNVPKDVPYGGQYAVMFAETSDGDKVQGTGVNAIKRIGMLVYSHVSGDTRKDAEIIENKFAALQWGAPLKTTSVVRNKGNVDVMASYELKVFSIFGKSVYEDNKEYTVLPVDADGRRRVNLEWSAAPALGLFKVKQTVKVLEETDVEYHWVLVIHPMVIVLTLTVLAILTIVIISKAKKRSSTNQRGLSKAGRKGA